MIKNIRSLLLTTVMLLPLFGCSSSYHDYHSSATTNGAVAGGAAGLILGGMSKVSIPVAILAGTGVGASYGALTQTQTGTIYRIVNSGIPVIKYGDNTVVVLPSDRFFSPDSDEFLPESMPMMSLILNLVKLNGDSPVTIAGYSDDVGSFDHNINMSQNQAQQVMSYFWSKGVDFHRMRAVGYGKRPEVASNLSYLGSHFNRRVEIRIHPAAY